MGNDVEGTVHVEVTADGSQAKQEFADTAAAEQQVGDSAQSASSASSAYFEGLAARVAAVKVEVADLSEIVKDEDLSLTFDQMQSAVGRATVAVAELRSVVASLQASGQPVPASTLAALAQAEAQVTSLTTELHALAAAEEEAGTAGQAAGGRVGGSAPEIEKAAVSSRGFRVALLDMTTGIGGVVGALAPWILALTLAPTVISQVSKGIETLVGWLATGRDKLADWIEGVDSSTDAERKKGETDQEYADRLKTVADLQQKGTEAVFAQAAGLISETSNVKLATVEWIAHQAAIQKTPELYALLNAALAAAGLKTVKTFDDIKTEAEKLEVSLQAELAVNGPAAAATFAEKNRAAVQEVVQGYADAGQRVPPAIQKIADALGIESRQAEQASKLHAEIDKTLQKMSDQYLASVPKLAALSLELQKNEQEYTKSTAAIEEHRRQANAAIEDETKNTVSGLYAQISALKEKGLSDQQYADEVNRILGEVKKVRDDATKAELKNNDDAKQSQDALDRDEADKLIKFQERARAEGTSLQGLTVFRQTLQKAVVDLTGKVEEELKAHGLAAAAAVAAGDRLKTDATPKVENHAKAVEKVNGALRDMPTASAGAVGSLGQLGSAVDEVAEKLLRTQQILNELNGAATGGSPNGGAGGSATAAAGRP